MTGFYTEGEASYWEKMFPPRGNRKKIQKSIKLTEKDKGGHFYITEKRRIKMEQVVIYLKQISFKVRLRAAKYFWNNKAFKES